MITGQCIWRYSLNMKQWKSIGKLPFFLERQSGILTSDEKFIILSCDSLRRIYGLEISDDKCLLHQSSIVNPWKGDYRMVITGGLKDEMLVCGWIRHQFQAYQYIPEPPMYLMKLIAQWYNQEEIHCIEVYSKRHFTINIKHIICSFQPIKWNQTMTLK